MTIKKSYRELAEILKNVRAQDKKGKSIAFFNAVQKAIELVYSVKKKDKKLIFIGNGASAAIAAHMAADYLKNGGIKAITFNDPALLTCVSNDLGYESVFKRPIEVLADSGDLLIAISSSGKSKNILLAAQAANKKGCQIITLSGFKPDNPLIEQGDLNFYVPSSQYSHVEIIHHSICHYMLDIIIEAKND